MFDSLVGLGILLFMLFILFIISFLFYIFTSIGIYNIAKKRNIEYPWLAFIPLAQDYNLGAIVDNINAYRQKQTNNKFILLGLSIAFSMVNSTKVSMFSDFGVTFGILSIIIMIAHRVYRLKILYDIYQDYAPSNAVLFLVLSTIFYIDFVFLFAIRNKVPKSMCFSKQDE